MLVKNKSKHKLYSPQNNGFNQNLRLTSPICENALLTVIFLFKFQNCCQIFKIRLRWKHIDLMFMYNIEINIIYSDVQVRGRRNGFVLFVKQDLQNVEIMTGNLIILKSNISYFTR